eukprot:6209511-Pleurochrysis_carterae.AAC.1
MYNVKTLEQPLRIAASALEQLASIRPAQYPFPASIPAIYRQPGAGSRASSSSSSQQRISQQTMQQQTSQQEGTQQQACTGDARHNRLGAGASRTAGAVGKQRVQQHRKDLASAIDSSDDKYQAAAGTSKAGDPNFDETTNAAEDDDDDPPPPVSDGMSFVNWAGTREEVHEFLLWTSVDGAAPCWHHGKVRRALKGER